MACPACHRVSYLCNWKITVGIAIPRVDADHSFPSRQQQRGSRISVRAAITAPPGRGRRTEVREAFTAGSRTGMGRLWPGCPFLSPVRFICFGSIIRVWAGYLPRNIRDCPTSGGRGGGWLIYCFDNYRNIG